MVLRDDAAQGSGAEASIRGQTSIRFSKRQGRWVLLERLLQLRRLYSVYGPPLEKALLRLLHVTCNRRVKEKGDAPDLDAPAAATPGQPSSQKPAYAVFAHTQTSGHIWGHGRGARGRGRAAWLGPSVRLCLLPPAAGLAPLTVKEATTLQLGARLRAQHAARAEYVAWALAVGAAPPSAGEVSAATKALLAGMKQLWKVD